jgi:hypothetical protein
MTGGLPLRGGIDATKQAPSETDSYLSTPLRTESRADFCSEDA